jgi:hypothetical protein
MTVIVALICVLTEVSLVMYGQLEPLLRATPALALVAFAVYTAFWVPLLRISPTEIEIVNPLRTHRIGWHAVKDISTRWTLTVITDSGRYQAWAAPAESPWGSLGRLNRDVLGRPSLSKADSRLPSSVAALAPILINRQWENYRDSEIGAAGDAVTTRWHSATIIALVALAALTLIGLVWP